MLDVSKKLDRQSKDLLIAVHEATSRLGAPCLVVGAFARDVVLGYGHGIETGPATLDIDFAVMLESWDQFHALRANLLDVAGFGSVEGVAHRLRFRNGRPLDLIPFGSIEGKPGEIAWPPDFATVMSTVGFREASARTVAVMIDDGVEIPFASPAGLALLKLISWNGRDAATRRKDARDIAVLVPNYLKAGNEQRLYEEHGDLLDEPDFDFELAGARILGRDLGEIMGPTPRIRVLELLRIDSDLARGLALASEMKLQGDRAVALLGSMQRGIEETLDSYAE